MQKIKQPLAILLIVAFFLGIGFLTDLVWDKMEKATHPQDFGDIVKKYAAEYGIPEHVLFAVIKTESGFDPNATSRAGAIGLMQMTAIAHEDTVARLKDGTAFRDLYDPDVNVRHGACYLQMMYELFGGDWELALAAYNAGPGNVSQWLKNPDYTDEYGKLTYVPFDETRSYISKVNSAMEQYQKLYYTTNEGVES